MLIELKGDIFTTHANLMHETATTSGVGSVWVFIRSWNTFRALKSRFLISSAPPPLETPEARTNCMRAESQVCAEGSTGSCWNALRTRGRESSKNKLKWTDHKQIN